MPNLTVSANVDTLMQAANFAAFKTSLSLNNVENTALTTWTGAGTVVTVGTLTSGATGAGFTVALGASTITGDLAFANFVQASAASKLVGRGSASGAGDFQEITLGTGLSMSGTTLSSTGSGDVTAAASFGTDNVLIRSDGTGKGVQASGISIDDSDNITGVGDVTAATVAATTMTVGGITFSATGMLLGETSTGWIYLDPALSAATSASGIVESGTAGAALAYGESVYFAVADSRWELTDSDAAATAGPVKVGICVLAAAADGDPTIILRWGKVRADAVFPALTVGAPVYIGTTPGAIQVAAPSGTDDVVRILGHAVTADSIWFEPDNFWITVV